MESIEVKAEIGIYYRNFKWSEGKIFTRKEQDNDSWIIGSTWIYSKKKVTVTVPTSLGQFKKVFSTEME